MSFAQCQKSQPEKAETRCDRRCRLKPLPLPVPVRASIRRRPSLSRFPPAWCTAGYAEEACAQAAVGDKFLVPCGPRRGLRSWCSAESAAGADRRPAGRIPESRAQHASHLRLGEQCFGNGKGRRWDRQASPVSPRALTPSMAVPM